MSRERERNRADAIASFRTEMLEVMATLGGEFDSRIKELQVRKKEIDDYEDAKALIAKAVEVRTLLAQETAAAKAQAADILDQANNQLKTVTRQQGDLKSLATQLNSKDENLRLREATMEKTIAEFSKTKADAEVSITARGNAIQQREAKIAADQAVVQTLKAQLSERLQKLDERLKLLGTL
jgi:chromosome segregation ATPase